MKTGVLVWKKESLLHVVLEVIVISVPDVKCIALGLCVQLMDSSLLDAQVCVHIKY